MTENELIENLNLEPNIKFIYRKLDGTNRIADGTRQTGDFNDAWDTPREVHTYWDNEKGDYRCFKDGNYIGTIKEEPKNVIFRGESLIPRSRRSE